MKGVSFAMDKKESNEKLIKRLNAIISREVEKPYTEMDADLVEAGVELVLELQGKNYTLSNEEIEEKVSKIPFADTSNIKPVPQAKKKIKKRKILLIAAIIAILCTLFTVMSSSGFIEYWHIVIKEKFGSVFNAPVGESFTEGNEEFYFNGKTNYYTSPEEFSKNENYDVLLPCKLPEGIELVNVFISEADNIIYASFDSIVTSYNIQLNTSLPQAITENINKTISLNNITCYIDNLEDISTVQVYFEHNGNFYTVSGTDEQILLNIIENLEEYE